MTETPTRPWHRLALVAVLALATALHFLWLDREGYGNLYYAAAVRSMLTSWHNFFFVSFDPGGFVTVDKPPLGLWVQALSALVFGFNGWALMLPQALSGVLSVALLYHLVQRAFGAPAGIVAALVLTLTPISIAANRNNTMDSQLVLTSLLAAWAFIHAAETGRLRWLLLGAGLVGLGFNIKMLQAFLVLPALYAVYFFGARAGWLKRLWHLGLASLLLGAVSLSWAVIVDLTPVDERPFVGSSTDNTVMELIIGHNGAARLGLVGQLFGIQAGGPRTRPPDAPGNPPQGAPPQNPPPQFARPQGAPSLNAPGAGPQSARPGGLQDETGEAGALRLFNQQLGGQASWLLPMAFACLMASALHLGGRRPLSAQHHALIMWGMWLTPQVLFFSFAGLFHRYYLEMLAPGIAALVGIGLTTLWRDYQSGHWRGWLLPLVLLIGAATECALLLAWPEWAAWLIPATVVLCGSAIAGLIVMRVRRTPDTTWSGALAALGLIGLLVAPGVWSAFPLAGGSANLPYSSPELLRGAGPLNAARGQSLPNNDRLIDYLTAHRDGAFYLAATLNANTAAPLILATGEPVMAMGGFSGSDVILSETDLVSMVAAGTVRYFLAPATGPGGAQNNAPRLGGGNGALTQWVAANCSAVPQAEWQTQNAAPANPGPNGPVQLFDCGTSG
jgi:4-amino-4-deoxy-L-arabinose transferase-like glycosyltransferase